MSQIVHPSTERPLPVQANFWQVWPALVEVAILALTAPLFYFPDRVQNLVANACGCAPEWLLPFGVGLLALLWPVRRWLTGQWAAVLPVQPRWLMPLATGALWFWFLVMLPIAIWVAPQPLRELYSWPRGAILVWNFSLFWTVLAYARRERRALGWALVGWLAVVLAIALLAPFGMEARTKLPVIGRIQEMIPRPLLGVFSGAESGFSTNQVAGVLLYVLPLMIALTAAGWRARGWRWWLLFMATGWVGATLALTQSRGGLLGLAVALAVLLLLTRRWGWYALAGLALVGAVVFFTLPPNVLDVLGDAPGVNMVGGVVTVRSFRLMVWEAGQLALGDFFFTGMGLGTFRALVHLLYPLPGIPADYDLAHAHNFFLQAGLDFGVPGLVAILALYVAAIAQVVRLAFWPGQRAIWPQMPFVTPRVLAIGWMGCLVGQTVYSLFDAVTFGSKPNFVWWWWLALIFAAGHWVARGRENPSLALPRLGRE